MLSKEILEFVMPEMLEKDKVKMLRDVPKSQKNEIKFESTNFELLYKEYLCNVSYQNHSPDNEELQEFNRTLQEINKGNCKNLLAKLNSLLMNFLLDNFPDNLVTLMDLVSLLEIKEKKEAKQEDLIEMFKNVLILEQNVDISSPDLSINKSKLLSSWGLKISRDWESSLQKKHRNSFIFRFLQNSVLEINTILYKMKQFDVRTETGGLLKIENSIKNKSSGNKFWRPMGSLITTIYEHDDVVSCLEALKDNRRFISGSYDGFIRVFDLEKIEK
jgi:hypothetical protein